MSPGPLQILIIILLVFVLFGANRVPGIMENLAKGINSFKKGLKEGDPDKPQIGHDKPVSQNQKDLAKARDEE
ncbi:MAG: twin-arginine translocase TatA/TatE family subunit [Alphaproteobacteria bacterium]|nr:twin-arginine translocase TatA/TatE family subunit [Alphaproteobacteria bacterium]MBP7759913.1 twin-arginine translocase TatA/TatE family subunit [Alphaproteobacteria bacterium]MBP7763244.1 twin-arginine translocase TatA/TatE family subunit [Alphaproteobacteria bacterium]MBP7904947.1 twin-arginine translocase TatA/TatE family subunit [Alphaproteobacteria bacterium]